MRNVLLLGLSILICSCSSSSNDENAQGASSDSQAAKVTHAPNPAKLYGLYCVACHGNDGKAGVGGAKNLAISELSEEGVREMIKNGSGNGKMMAYGNLLEDSEIEALATYVIGLRETQE